MKKKARDSEVHDKAAGGGLVGKPRGTRVFKTAANSRRRLLRVPGSR